MPKLLRQHIMPAKIHMKSIFTMYTNLRLYYLTTLKKDFRQISIPSHTIRYDTSPC